VPDYLTLCDERNRTKIEQRIDGHGLMIIRRVAASPRKLGSIEVLDPSSGEFSTPTGIDAAMKPLLPEIIFIPALADVAAEAKGAQKDSLGQLVGQVMSAIADQVQPRLDEAYEQANRLLNVRANPETGAEQDERAAELAGIERDITRHLNETFPKASVRLKVRLPSVRSILGQIDVVVREGTHEDPYYRRGHGLQRTLYLSLLRALATRIRERTQREVVRPFILLFEEPEAFLHPEGQIKMRNALEAISQRAQVALATHSPIIVTPDFVDKTIRIEKRVDEKYPKPVTKRFGPIDEATLTAAQRQLLPLFALQRSSRFLFSRGVLLVEGVGDEHLFPAIAQQLRNFNLEASEIAVVESGGKDHLYAFSQLLQALGLQTWILTDIDFLWSGAGRVLREDAELSTFCEELNQIVPEIPLGERTDAAMRDRRRRQKQAAITQLAGQRTTLCDSLFEQGIFVLREGEIEDYVELTPTSKGQYLKAAEEIRNGKRNVQHRAELERIISVLEAWSGS